MKSPLIGLGTLIAILGCTSPQPLLLYATIGNSVSVTPPPPVPPPDEKAISPSASLAQSDSELARRVGEIPGHGGTTAIAVAVVRNGEPAFIVARGVERKGGRPATGETLFRIGSVGKILTGIAVLQAVERGEISLDQSLAPLIPRLDPAITLRLLLSHQAGIPDRSECEAGLKTPSQWADRYATLRPWFPAGALFNYSNSDMILAAAALERATGRAFADLVRERIFLPAGMEGATYRIEDSSRPKAVGYDRNGVAVADEPACGLTIAAGAAWMSVRDLSRLACALLRKQNALLRPAEMEEFLKPYRSTNGADIEHTGLGIFMRRHRGRTIAYHGGSMNGFAAEIVMDFESGFALAVLANAAGAAGFPGAAIDLYLPPREPLGQPPLPRGDFGGYPGLYRDSSGELGTFRIRRVGEDRFRMLPIGKRKVRRFNDSFSGTFWRDSSGVFRYFATRWGVAKRIGE